MPEYNIGERINVSGLSQELDNGEICVANPTITGCGSGSITPIALNNRALGGGSFGNQDGVWGWEVVKDEAGKCHHKWMKSRGLNNIGLLVKTWGKVGNITPSSFTIDDGYGVNVRCILPVGVRLDVGATYVSITGISSCEKVGSELRRLIRVRSQDDIVKIQ